MQSLQTDCRSFYFEKFNNFIDRVDYPCIGAKSARSSDSIQFFLGDSLQCPSSDARLLEGLYDFIGNWEESGDIFRSFVAIFPYDDSYTENGFETALWHRLEALHHMDREYFPWDPTVSKDPQSPNFSYSLGGQAFYIVGLHPNSSRKARRFDFPALVFNLHAQFEVLRKQDKYDRFKSIVRRRDLYHSGSINPMLEDFGQGLEAAQYSGKKTNTKSWGCPVTFQRKVN